MKLKRMIEMNKIMIISNQIKSNQIIPPSEQNVKENAVSGDLLLWAVLSALTLFSQRGNLSLTFHCLIFNHPRSETPFISASYESTCFMLVLLFKISYLLTTFLC